MSDPLSQSNVPPPNSEPTDAKAKAGLPVPGSAPPRVRKKHWGRRVALGLLSILILIGIFVLLAPTLAGTAPVRRAMLTKLNEKLNGSVEIQNWSFGWTSGIQVDGIKVFDDRKAEILSVAHLRSGLTLLDAIRGRFHCGETVIDEPNLEQFIVYADGSNNFQKLLKQGLPGAQNPRNVPSNEPANDRSENAKKEGESSKPMDLQGHFTVNRLRGFIQDQRAGEPIIIAPESSMSVKINTLAEPIGNSLLLVYRVGINGLPGTIKIGGTAQTGERGNIDEKLELSSVSLAALNPLLAMAGKKLEFGGIVNGAIAIKAATSAPFSAEGKITADRFTASGDALQGETYSTGKLIVPVKVSGTSTDPKTARLQIESMGIQTDQATVGLTGDVSLAALQNAMQGRAPGSDGKLTVAFDIPSVKPLADQLPKTLHLQDGVKLAAGQLYHETNIWLSVGKTVVESKTDIQNIAGMNKDRSIALSPIHQTTDVTLLPGTAVISDLHDLAITLVSGFATIQGGGKTLADLDLKGNLDLPKLQKELGQFVDFGKVNLGGTAEFAIRTNGDPTKAGAPIKLDVKATVANLVTAGLEGATKNALPPLKVTSGTANIKVSIARDEASGKTQFQEGRLIVNHLALERGESKYASTDDAVAVQFAGEMISTDRVHGMTVSKFSGTAFGGTIKMPEPLVVTGLGGAVSANGSIALTGKMVDIASVLETLQAKPNGKGFPYRGDYRLAERVGTKGDVITLTGDGGIADFQVNDAAGRQAVFAEKQVSLGNQVSYDSRLKNLNITMLKLDMSGSDALHLAIGGSVQDVGGRQAFDNVKVTLGYDLEKLWPIIYPMLTPAQQADLKAHYKSVTDSAKGVSDIKTNTKSTPAELTVTELNPKPRPTDVKDKIPTLF